MNHGLSPVGFSDHQTLYRRQQPVFQVQMHVRRRVPLLKIVSLHTMLSKLRAARAQLIVAHAMHLVAPLTVRRSNAYSRPPVSEAELERLLAQYVDDNGVRVRILKGVRKHELQ
jgi:hypothetical protein